MHCCHFEGSRKSRHFLSTLFNSVCLLKTRGCLVMLYKLWSVAAVFSCCSRGTHVAFKNFGGELLLFLSAVSSFVAANLNTTCWVRKSEKVDVVRNESLLVVVVVWISFWLLGFLLLPLLLLTVATFLVQWTIFFQPVSQTYFVVHHFLSFSRKQKFVVLFLFFLFSLLSV